MKYPVVASDLDGTLLSPNHDLTSYTKDTLKQLVTSQDVHFVFATGRHHVDVAQIRDGLGIDAYMITSNGARIHNTRGDLIFEHNVAPEIAHELCLMEFDNPELITNYYHGDDWFINRESPEQKEFLKNRYLTISYLIAMTLSLLRSVKCTIPVKTMICWWIYSSVFKHVGKIK